MSSLAPALLAAALAVAIAPAGALAVDWSKAKKVTVVTVEYAFKPADPTFHVGTTYRLHLENKGKETHEFTAPIFFAASKIANPDVLNREHTEIVMQPGDAKDLLVTPGPPGVYDLRCSDHDWNGMTGGITVQ